MTGVYRYRAARADGGIVSGELEATTGAQADSLLEGRGLFPIAVEPVARAESHRRSASRKELAIVFRSLATLVAAGVPLERALASTETLAGASLRTCLAAGRAELRAGRSLAEALQAGRGVVPDVAIGVLKAGERAGRLAPALEQVAIQLEHEAELAGSIRQALAYPMLLAVTSLGSMLVIGGVVVPRFAALIGDLGHDLPPATRVLLGVSDFVGRYWGMMLVVTWATVWLVARWARTPAGRLRLHNRLLGAPLIGPVRHGLATARASRALGGALAAGMPLLSALEIGAGAAGDRAVSARLANVRERVARGETLSQALGRERALTPAGLQLLEVGEQSAQLATMASRAAELSGRDCERRLRVLTAMVEPALVVALGGMVAFTAAALLQAIYGIRPGGF